jgi:hypothetical protein
LITFLFLIATVVVIGLLAWVGTIIGANIGIPMGWILPFGFVFLVIAAAGMSSAFE